jgi:uncharacterized membrane protein YuzA (DUF378 family)
LLRVRFLYLKLQIILSNFERRCKMKNVIDKVAMLLVIVGGLNWGLVGVWNYDLVASMLGSGTLGRAVYVLVGLSALWMAYYAYEEMM